MRKTRTVPAPAASRPVAAPGAPLPSPDRLGAQPADIALFVRAVELGTFSAVARERDVPVSHVSRAVDRLEAVWRVRLLRRSTHGLSLTPEGSTVLAYGRQALATLSDLGDELDRRTRAVSGPVRLAASPAMAEEWLVPALPRLRERHPGLQVELLADDRIADLPTEGIDVALRTSVVASDSLVARRIGTFSRGLYASPAYLARHGAPEQPEALHQHAIVSHLAAGHLNRWPFRVGRRSVTLSVRGSLAANSTWLVTRMLLAGLGIGRLSRPLAARHVREGALVEVLAAHRDPAEQPIFAVMLPERHRLPRTRALVEWLVQVMETSGGGRA